MRRWIDVVAPLLLTTAFFVATPAVAHEPGSHATEIQTPRTIPDVPVLDQDGHNLSFYRDLVRGRTVAIDFVFTQCSTFCRPVTANLRSVQEQLGDRIGKDIVLISVSVDPLNDTPASLKAYAAEFGAGPGWSFVTGDKPQIDRLLTAFGVGTHGPEDHSSLTLIGNDKTGTWTWTDSLASPETIAAALLQAAGPPHGTDRDRIAAATARYLPNVELTDQNGKSVHLYDDLLKDKIVVLDFIYTQCTEACSPLTQNLAAVQDLLGNKVGGPVNMVSISVDPANDTPPVLKAFAARFGAKAGWSFLTGPAANLEIVTRKLGGFTTNWQDHSTQLVIGNVPTGQWVKINGLASPEVIARAVLRISGAGG